MEEGVAEVVSAAVVDVVVDFLVANVLLSAEFNEIVRQNNLLLVDKDELRTAANMVIVQRGRGGVEAVVTKEIVLVGCELLFWIAIIVILI